LELSVVPIQEVVTGRMLLWRREWPPVPICWAVAKSICHFPKTSAARA